MFRPVWLPLGITIIKCLGDGYCSIKVNNGMRSHLLRAFAKFRRVTISFNMSVRSSVLMEQLGSHQTEFHKIWYLKI